MNNPKPELREEIAACPWCDEPRDINFTRVSNAQGQMRCGTCGAGGPLAYDDGDGDEERAPSAIAAWNRRADTRPTPADREVKQELSPSCTDIAAVSQEARPADAEPSRSQRLMGQAWIDGFLRGIGREPWEDMHDWAALTADDYIRAIARNEP